MSLYFEIEQGHAQRLFLLTAVAKLFPLIAYELNFFYQRKVTNINENISNVLTDPIMIGLNVILASHILKRVVLFLRWYSKSFLLRASKLRDKLADISLQNIFPVIYSNIFLG